MNMYKSIPHYTHILSAILMLFAVAGFILASFTIQTNQVLNSRISGLESSVASLSLTLSKNQPVATAAIPSSQDLLTAAIAKVSPSVVSIIASKKIPSGVLSTSNIRATQAMAENTASLVKVGAGSGFVVSSDGYIVTNKHVVDDPTAQYAVVFSNNTQKIATVVYRDSNTDIAVLKIAATNLPAVTFGDSSQLEVGQTVEAIGNALGEYSNSVSVGIISGLHRTIDAASVENGSTEPLSNTIQTDAAINPGNSGGPLFNLQGQVIGVNVATIIGSNNISFSIPSNTVKAIVASVVQN